MLGKTITLSAIAALAAAALVPAAAEARPYDGYARGDHYAAGYHDVRYDSRRGGGYYGNRGYYGGNGYYGRGYSNRAYYGGGRGRSPPDVVAADGRRLC